MASERLRWKRRFWTSAILAMLLAVSLAPYLTSSTELVRLRNSLLYEPIPADAAWTPAHPPEGYLVESSAPTSFFSEAVAASDLAVQGDDWETALRIGRHLLQGVVAHRGNGGPIQRGLQETYDRITGRGEGYCGDYVDNFIALATTAGIFSRAWAFSFDGFGGHGHIFNEIWDRQTRAWRLIDVFNNYYVVDDTGRPMSALEFRDLLLRGEAIAWRPVEPAARPGFKYEEKAAEYYRRGVNEWYLWWGNNVFQYDGNDTVEAFSTASRALGQLSAVAVGVHPPIRVLSSPENRVMQDKLERTRWHFLAVLIALPFLGLGMLVSLWNMRSRTTRRHRN